MSLELNDLVVAIIATIASSLLGYALWGRKTNKLNNLLIEEQMKLKQDSLKANIVAGIKKSSRDDITLSFFYLELKNIGGSEAKELMLKNYDASNVEFHNVSKFPINLEVGQSTIVNLSTNDEVIYFDIEWDDSYSSNRNKEYSLALI